MMFWLEGWYWPAATTNNQTKMSISKALCGFAHWIKCRILAHSAPDYKNSFCFFIFSAAEYSADLNLDEMITGQEGLKKIRTALWETLNGQ